MQVETNNTTLLVDLLQSAKKIAIVPNKASGADAFSAAAGLYLMLKDADKAVSLIYQGKIPTECEGLVAKNDITSNIFQRELLVSIDYSNTTAANIHWETERDTLYLKVSPVPKNFERSRVKSELIGFDFDVIITLGVQELEDLGQTHRELSDEFSKAKIINIDNTDKNMRFGSVNLVDAKADNLSLMVFNSAAAWGLTPGAQAAKALLTGMTYKDSNKIPAV